MSSPLRFMLVVIRAPCVITVINMFEKNHKILSRAQHIQSLAQDAFSNINGPSVLWRSHKLCVLFTLKRSPFARKSLELKGDAANNLSLFLSPAPSLHFL